MAWLHATRQADTPSPDTGTAPHEQHDLLALQRFAGNAAVTRVVQRNVHTGHPGPSDHQPALTQAPGSRLLRQAIAIAGPAQRQVLRTALQAVAPPETGPPAESVTVAVFGQSISLPQADVPGLLASFDHHSEAAEAWAASLPPTRPASPGHTGADTVAQLHLREAVRRLAAGGLTPAQRTAVTDRMVELRAALDQYFTTLLNRPGDQATTEATAAGGLTLTGIAPAAAETGLLATARLLLSGVAAAAMTVSFDFSTEQLLAEQYAQIQARDAALREVLRPLPPPPEPEQDPRPPVDGTVPLAIGIAAAAARNARPTTETVVDQDPHPRTSSGCHGCALGLSIDFSAVQQYNDGHRHGHEFATLISTVLRPDSPSGPPPPVTPDMDCRLEWWESSSLPDVTAGHPAANTWYEKANTGGRSFAGWHNRPRICDGVPYVYRDIDEPGLARGPHPTGTVTRVLRFFIVLKSSPACTHHPQPLIVTATQVLRLDNGVPNMRAGRFDPGIAAGAGRPPGY